MSFIFFRINNTSCLLPFHIIISTKKKISIETCTIKTDLQSKNINIFQLSETVSCNLVWMSLRGVSLPGSPKFRIVGFSL